jgi:hypothetical protein
MSQPGTLMQLLIRLSKVPLQDTFRAEIHNEQYHCLAREEKGYTTQAALHKVYFLHPLHDLNSALFP